MTILINKQNGEVTAYFEGVKVGVFESVENYEAWVAEAEKADRAEYFMNV